MAYGQITQYAEDAPHADGDKGIQFLAIRDDTLNARSGAENDYEPLHTNANGALWTIDVNSDAVKTAVEAIQAGQLADGHNVTVDNASLAVTGTFWQATQPISGTVSVTGVSTLAEQQSQTTHLATIAGDTTAIQAAAELSDDVVYVDDADWTDNTSKHTLVGGVYQSAPHTVTDGDVTPFLTDVNGRLATVVSGTVAVSNAGLTELAAAINGSSQMDVNIAANGIGLATSAKQDTMIGHLDGLETLIGTTNTTLTTIDGRVDGIEGLLTTIDGDTGALAALILATQADDVANTSDGLQVTNFNMVYDGSTWDRLRGTSADGMLVNLGSNNDVTVTGTVAVTQSGTWDEVGINDSGNSITVDAPVATPVNVQLGNGTLTQGVVDETGSSAVDAAAIGGGTPHDSVDSGNPVKVGFKANNALPTAVANNDRANGIADLWGRQLVSHIDPAMQVNKTVNVTTTQTGTDIRSPTSGKKIAITSYTISAYGTTAGRVILWFGDNADTTYTAGTDQVLGIFSFAPSATQKPGAVVTLPTPVFCTTADRELHLTTDAGISLDITVYGYER